MVVYFISGLGADKRAFEHLVLPADWEIIHLNWIPVITNESLESYVLRFSKQINTEKIFSLVGLSFGGIMAVELSKLIHPHKIILLSSISSNKELPFSYRLLAVTGIHQWVPQNWLNKVFPFTNWYFGVHTKEEVQLLKAIIHDTSPAFLKWAIDEILNWKNTTKPTGVFHIHGSSDRIFSINNIKADLVIKNGGHFMVHNKAAEISKILIDQLQKG